MKVNKKRTIISYNIIDHNGNKFEFTISYGDDYSKEDFDKDSECLAEEASRNDKIFKFPHNKGVTIIKSSDISSIEMIVEAESENFIE